VNRFFAFPNLVNDAAARTVAIGVVTMSVVTFFTGWTFLLILLTYGFLARVLAGPTISPLGQFAVRVMGPRIKRWEKFVPGPPKRFAQAIGLCFMVAIDFVTWTNGFSVARWIFLPLLVAASLEGFVGYCVGCAVFGQLMKIGVIPESVCVECSNLPARLARLAKEQTAASK
jgi:hypothetical protein